MNDPSLNPEPPRLEPPAPVRLPGARPGVAYGATAAALVLGVVVATLVFSYGFLAVNASAWPPDDVPRPAVARPTAGAVMVVIAAAVMLIARGGLADEPSRRRFLPALVLSALFGALGASLLWTETANQPFAADSHSYAAAVFVLYGTIVTLVCLCVYANLFLVACVLRRKVGREHEGAGHVARTAWATTAAVTVVLVLVVIVGASLW